MATALFLGFGKITSTEEKITKLGFEDIGELVTQSAYCTEIGFIDSARGEELGIKIPFTQSKYIFSYDFKILAGLDFSEIEWTLDETTKTIEVSLPPITIIDSTTMENSFKVYHESESVFNQISLEENNAEVLKLKRNAEQDAIANGLFENARTNAKALLKGFFANAYNLEEYEIRFVDKKTY